MSKYVDTLPGVKRTHAHSGAVSPEGQHSYAPPPPPSRDVTPLQSAHGLVDGALDELLDKIDRLEEHLDDVLEPEADDGEADDEGVGPISPGPRCSKAVQRAQQHEDRIRRLSAEVAYILARLEC